MLYAFFNENLRKEFEFLVDCIVPSALLARSQNGSQRSQKSMATGLGNNGASKKLRPRRDLSLHGASKGEAGHENYISIDENDLDPTVHKDSSGLNELIQQQNASSSCECFKGPSSSSHDSPNGIEMAPI